jgi:citrate lyase subunit beta/citryl-CoA lyase
MAKALRAGADAVVLDLEDAVAAEAKASAREAVAATIAAADAAVSQVHVRVNPAGDGFDGDDVRAAVRPGLAALRLPTAASAAAGRALAAALDELEERAGLPPGRVRLYPTIVSAAGVLEASVRAAAPRV